MSINLQNGQKINLSKESRSGLNKVMVGLGWDEVPQNEGFFAPKPQDIDCDAFAILLGYDGKLLNHTNDIKQCTRVLQQPRLARRIDSPYGRQSDRCR